MTADRLFSGLKGRIKTRLFGRRTEAEAVYFSHPNLEIFLLPHDEPTRVSPAHDGQVLIVRNAWYPDQVPKFVKKQRKRMGRPHKNVIFLSNTEEIHRERLKWGFNSHFININCFLDEDIFRPARDSVPKRYDAAAIGRFTWHKFRELKRHDLMCEVGALALLDPIFGTTDLKLKQKYSTRHNCKFYNDQRLTPQEVAEILQQSHCGLILSAHEGACRASCEYLATGLPVVSTSSVGGRDVWLDDYNSIIVKPDPREVREAVDVFKRSPRDPELIRENFLKKAQTFRERFKSQVLVPVLREFDVEMNADDVMKENPFFWWPGERERPGSITSDMALDFQDFGVGNISPTVIEFIYSRVKPGSAILEFGSGLGSRELSKAFHVTSIEHDLQFLNRFHSDYIHAELQESDQYYREDACRRALSKQDYDVVLVDGPPAYQRGNCRSRLGFQKYVGHFRKNTVIIFDDVNRWWDCLNLLQTFFRLRRDVVIIEEGYRRCAVLTQDRPNFDTLLRLTYLLLTSFPYKYDP